jgi:hypothetical protein
VEFAAGYTYSENGLAAKLMSSLVESAQVGSPAKKISIPLEEKN